ncbi:MAG: phosphate signaling complex protein PhoU [Deltaproteobacteria bacterium]|jgi:phosphate transport system protein|nr:phosphate signaling complex protein PhoU [Deltaproteobacteria bacterium]MBW2499151.1 phosphate signaling complex protein PhoU [Deltaproteobacteria bacterium]
MPHRTRPKIDREIPELRDQLLRMAGLCEEILDKSLHAIWSRDASLAAEVVTDDIAIDRIEVAIDDAVLQILALASPVAGDLRQVLAIKTIASNLERVGDLARNIAGCAERLSKRNPITLPPGLHALADDSRALLRRSIESFVSLDATAARLVLDRDDLIDELEDLLIRETIARLMANPDHTEQELDVIFIAQHLERIGDHATNIAEEVILAAEALNLKHSEKLANGGGE